MYPSELILDRRASKDQWPLISPVPAFTVSLCVLNDPYEPFSSAYGFSEKSPVCMLILAPKAPAPLVEVPAPRWICMSLTDDAKSGRFTQNTLWLSASLIGIPLAVTLMRVPSVPRTLNVVYPIPAPASLVVMAEGVILNRYGKSCPKFCFLSCSLLMLVNATGVVPVARVEIISTSCKSITRKLSFSFVCAQTFSAAINRHAIIAYFFICNLNY